MNKGATDPNFQEDYEMIKGNLDSFKNTDVNTRDFALPTPSPTFNPFETWNKVSKDIETSSQSKQGKDLGGNNIEYITEDIYDPAKRT